jgi:hypothetical protein
MLLADLDAAQLNGGSNGGWGRPRQPKPSHGSTYIKSAKTISAQGNVSNNLALGLGFHGLAFANATSAQENGAIIGTVAA